MTGARSCDGLSPELYIPFDFQAEALNSPFTTLISNTLNVG